MTNLQSDPIFRGNPSEHGGRKHRKFQHSVRLSRCFRKSSIVNRLGDGYGAVLCGIECDC